MRVIDYEWRLPELMHAAQLHKSTDIQRALKERDVEMSYSQVYRLVTERPDRLNLQVLVTLMDILNCTADDLIHPLPVAVKATATGTAGPTATGPSNAALRASGSRPKRARLVSDESA